MLRVLRTPLAEQDLAAIWSYIATDNVDAADRMIRRLDERFRLLLKDPNMGDSMERYGTGLRATAVGPWVIYFRRTDVGIEVYRVLHGSQQRGDHL